MAASKRFLFAQEVARLMDAVTELDETIQVLGKVAELFSDEPHTPVVRYAALELLFQNPLQADSLQIIRTMASCGCRFSPKEVAGVLLQACRQQSYSPAHLGECNAYQCDALHLASAFFVAFSNSENFAAVCHHLSCREEGEDADVEESDELKNSPFEDMVKVRLLWSRAYSQRGDRNSVN